MNGICNGRWKTPLRAFTARCGEFSVVAQCGWWWKQRGRYESDLVDGACGSGLPVVILQPLLVRRFAGALNQLAKTDKIDAAVIAELGARLKPRLSRLL